MVKEFNYRNFNKVKFYYGIVNEVLENYSVRFRIPEIIDNLDDDEYPIAHPILKHTSEIFKNDTIIIMQLDVDMQEFVYFSNDVTEFTGLRFGKDIIDLSMGQDQHPELHIKISQLKAKDADNNDLEEGEEYSVLGPYSEITLTDKKIEVLKATPDKWKDPTGDGTDNDKKKALITIESPSDDATETVMTAVLFDDNKDSTERAKVSLDYQGNITITSTPDDNITTTKSQDTSGVILSKSVIKDNQTLSTITQTDDGKVTIEAQPNTGKKSSANFDENKILLSAGGGATSTVTIENTDSSQQVVLDTGTGSKQTVDGKNGVKIESVKQSSLDLGALIELKNIAGGLQGLLDDIWSELSTVNNNLFQLATMTSAISYAGPGALANATGGAIAGPSASIGTINAKKAKVSAVLQ